jgi:hypothetical protein
LLIATGAIRTCEVPIRTIATSVSELRFPVPPLEISGWVLLLQPFAAIKFKPVKPHK